MGITYVCNKCIHVPVSSPLWPWKPADMRLYTVRLTFSILYATADSWLSSERSTPMCIASFATGMTSFPINIDMSVPCTRLPQCWWKARITLLAGWSRYPTVINCGGYKLLQGVQTRRHYCYTITSCRCHTTKFSHIHPRARESI